MKQHSKLAATLLLMALTATAAQAQDKIVVETTSGQTTYDMDKVSRISIADAAIKVVETTGEGTTYAFDVLQRIVLNTGTNAIETPAAEQTGRLTLTVSADGTRLRVNGWAASDTAALQLFSTSGAAVLTQDGWTGQVVDISGLPHGVYVAKVGGHTAKFRK